jgi:hypothetical protein
LHLDLRCTQQPQALGPAASAAALPELSWIPAFPEQQCGDQDVTASVQHGGKGLSLRAKSAPEMGLVSAAGTAPTLAAPGSGGQEVMAAAARDCWAEGTAATATVAVGDPAWAEGTTSLSEAPGVAPATAHGAGGPFGQMHVLGLGKQIDTTAEGVFPEPGIKQGKGSEAVVSPSGLVCHEGSLHSTPGVSPLDAAVWHLHQQQGMGGLPAPIYHGGFSAGKAGEAGAGAGPAVAAVIDGGVDGSRLAMAGVEVAVPSQVRHCCVVLLCTCCTCFALVLVTWVTCNAQCTAP